MTGQMPDAELIVDGAGCATSPPPFPPAHRASSDADILKAPKPHESAETDEDDEALRLDLHNLSREQLIARVLASEQQLRGWKAAVSELVTTLALCPEMTEGYYARSLRNLLSESLQALDAIDSLRHIECSMPSVAAEAPSVTLLHWSGLPYSTWLVDWSPSSWWLSVSAVGSRWGLGFNSLTNVSAIYLRGRLRCAFSSDLTAVRISFVEPPELDMCIESSVGWGAVPIPVREQIEASVRAEIVSFVETRLTGEESMVFVLRRKALEKISDSDLLEARKQAERASMVNLRSPLL